MAVSHKRHLAKTITWRIVATTDTFIITFLASVLGFGYSTEQALTLGGVVAGFEVVTKMVLYYLHERAWYNYSEFGISDDQKGRS
tara:strand:- start:102 stop:356 length:255 start_codon:yes stop_codon:yes gene_type:complete